jgi:hypothetical protein
MLMSSQDFDTHFFDEVLIQDMAHINDLLFLGDTQVVLGILSSCVASYLTWTILLSFSFLFFLASFNMKVM